MNYKIVDYETYWRPHDRFGNLDILVELFDEVDEAYRAVVFPPSADIHPKNEELARALTQYSRRDRFIPCAYINPTVYTAVNELEVAVKTFGFKGMKLMPTIHRYNIDSNLVDPVMSKCHELEIPVTIHSSGEGGYPYLISKLANRFPEVPIIMDHSGYRYFQRQALQAGKENDNLYFGTSCVIEPTYIDRIAQEIGVDKIIYGSNAQGGIPKIGLMVFEYTHLSEAEKSLALGRNLIKLLRME